MVVFISDENEPASWGAAGRCCQRFALRAMASGIQPLNVAVGVYLKIKIADVPDNVPERTEQAAAYSGGADEARAAVRIAEQEAPLAELLEGVGGSVGFATSQLLCSQSRCWARLSIRTGDRAVGGEDFGCAELGAERERRLIRRIRGSVTAFRAFVSGLSSV